MLAPPRIEGDAIHRGHNEQLGTQGGCHRGEFGR